MYDYLIVGSGLYGAVFAHEARKVGKQCLVLERRAHIGGNVYTEDIEGITVHRYGAHIFHTANRDIWKYLCRFTEFNHYINSPIACYRGEFYNLPFNMNTFNRMWGVRTPQEAQEVLRQQRAGSADSPKNLEEQAIRLVGQDIYEKLVRGYTEKQWGRPCRELPAFIIRRLPVRFTYDNNYFNDPYQGIPKEGYTRIVERLLEGTEVRLNTDFLLNRCQYRKEAKKVIYTGTIDSYFDYCFGPLEYRSLRFESKVLSEENYQGAAVINYTDRETPYTRIIEHKHFQFGKQPKTVVTWEYPQAWTKGEEPYYPVNDQPNQEKYAQYQKLAKQEKGVLFGGRLGEYRYFDMDKTVASALKAVRREIEG